MPTHELVMQIVRQPVFTLFERGDDYHFNQVRNWNGLGSVVMDVKVVEQAEPYKTVQVGDVVTINGYALLLLERDYRRRAWIAMLETPDAHRFLMWKLAREAEELFTNWYLWFWEQFAMPAWELHEINLRLNQEGIF